MPRDAVACESARVTPRSETLTKVRDLVAAAWSDDLIESLADYIRIPALSKSVDPDWKANGYIDAAVRHLVAWAHTRLIIGMAIEVVELDDLTPIIVITVEPYRGESGEANTPAASVDTVLLYGHADKQPEMTGWREGLGAWTPVREGDRLYGRGGADDGYAIYAALTAIEACQAAGGRHARLVVLIETSEESGSPDLPRYIDHLSPTIGTPGLVICLDSGCDSYDRLCVTNSLRGIVNLDLTVEVVREGLHSGAVSGAVPSSMRIMRLLLDRIEDANTGTILVPELHTSIPPARIEEARERALGTTRAVRDWFPFAHDTRPVTEDPADAYLNMTWRPSVSYIGVAGLPSTRAAGNVLRPSTTLRLSFRLPPTVNPQAAFGAIRSALTSDPPYGARVTVDLDQAGEGWDASPAAPWLKAALAEAGQAFFGAPVDHVGEGGSIPFIAMLGHRFPASQFVVIGVIGPEANAHGPNEFLHLPMAQRITQSVAHLLDAHARSLR
jgi:acetylornithine deacetylase/succinyl-diaminopimelate desuccinylase-like protein